MDDSMAMDKPETRDELRDTFHMMIGYCIAEWANVDDELFRIFRDCVGPAEQCSIIYYRTPGLDVRLNLTDEIVKSVLPKTARKSGGHDHVSVKSWKAAIKDFRDLLGVRRRIAHHPNTIKYGASWPLILDLRYLLAPQSWFEIYVSQHEQLRSGELPALKLDDLKAHLTAVEALRARLQYFFSDVLTTRESTSSAPSLPPQIQISQQTGLSTKSQRRRKPSPP
jgi:hypothetical protein